MKLPASELLADLRRRTQAILAEASTWQNLPETTLNWRPTTETWSMLEGLEHVNLYGDFYLPEIEKRIEASRHPASPAFRSGWLGNYFSTLMLPGEKLVTMNTFKDKNPLGSTFGKEILHRFVQQQEKVLELLDRAEKVSLTRTRTNIAIAQGLIKLRLGDTLRVVVYHAQRHMVQARGVLAAQASEHSVTSASTTS